MRSAHITTWRVLTDGAGAVAWNMAMDEALLNSVVGNMSPPTVRLYQCRSFAITLGRFQNLERTIDTEACRKRHIPLVRRITGGRGILHGNDLTVSITAPISALDLPHKRSTLLEIYEHTSQWFIAALAKTGIVARSGNLLRMRGQECYGNCFDIISRADVVECASGRKVLGAALFRRGDTILQQVSIPLCYHRPSIGVGIGYDHCDDAGAIAREVFRGRREVLEDHCGPSPASRLDVGLLQAGIINILQCVYGDVQFATKASVSEITDAALLIQTRYDLELWNREGISMSPKIN